MFRRSALSLEPKVAYNELAEFLPLHDHKKHHEFTRVCRPHGCKTTKDAYECRPHSELIVLYLYLRFFLGTLVWQCILRALVHTPLEANLIQFVNILLF